MYRIYFHEVDPLDMIPDIVVNVKKFENVKAELYSKVEKNSNNAPSPVNPRIKSHFFLFPQKDNLSFRMYHQLIKKETNERKKINS